jgi:eukaryotic-like serine/threonine-protein kinase
VVGGGVYAFTRVPAPAQADGSGQSKPTGTMEPAAAVPAPTVPIAAAKEVVAAPDPQVKRVKVVILPADALVDVEGRRAPTQGGILEISGIPGSVHKVRIFKGTNETVTDVVVTDTGALPPKVELGLSPFKASPVKSAAAPVPGPAPSPAIPRGMIQDTDEFGKK